MNYLELPRKQQFRKYKLTNDTEEKHNQQKCRTTYKKSKTTDFNGININVLKKSKQYKSYIPHS